MDRNDVIRPAIDVFLASLSARRAWIEIGLHLHPSQNVRVALRKESVDRNFIILYIRVCVSTVALRKESVDRNNTMQVVIIIVDVALRKESVDRN